MYLLFYHCCEENDGKNYGIYFGHIDGHMDTYLDININRFIALAIMDA